MTVIDLLPSREGGPEAVRMEEGAHRAAARSARRAPGRAAPGLRRPRSRGMSFKAIAAQTGENLNTLLSRKRYAVLQLRRKLQDVFDELRTS